MWQGTQVSACLPICKSERHFQRWPGVLTSQLSSPKLLSSLRCIADFEQKSFPEFVPNLHQALNLCLKEVKFSISWLPSRDMLPGSSGRVIVLVTENSFLVTPCRVSAIKRRLSKPGGSWWYQEMPLQALAGEKNTGGTLDVIEYRNHLS